MSSTWDRPYKLQVPVKNEIEGVEKLRISREQEQSIRQAQGPPDPGALVTAAHSSSTPMKPVVLGCYHAVNLKCYIRNK